MAIFEPATPRPERGALPNLEAGAQSRPFLLVEHTASWNGSRPRAANTPAWAPGKDARLPANLSRIPMTVLADHGAPLGVPTWRAFNSAAAARADMPPNSDNTGAIPRASSSATTRRMTPSSPMVWEYTARGAQFHGNNSSN